ncbi:hypothetical protein ACE1B6_24325 [Aerosakkonemataceae cyanobacterium BLCC-F154]|uniref:Uncharacterized protein n=1 Tax=Floridaenema fluviatile BLCC-F154 TaxID=3153640 RepID=A0ABV4YIR1_9CYAN
MQVVLNQLNRSKDSSNEVHYLELIPKKQILKLLVAALAQPAQYALALADDLSPVEENTPAKDMITLSEWLESKGLELERSEKHKLALLLSRLYKEKTGSTPRVITRPDSRGKWLKKANGFTQEETPILQEALNEVIPDWKSRSTLATPSRKNTKSKTTKATTTSQK